MRTIAARSAVQISTPVESIHHEPPRLAPEDYPAGGRAFDWIIALLSGWLIGGLHLDGWAHNHHPDLETFFTPWHGVLYSGFFALFLTLLFTFARNCGRGYPRRRALPPGYDLSLVGGCIFLAGGVLDLTWHTLFGIEANTEALLSPTHIILATGITLMVGGPLRAAWRRPPPDGGQATFVAMLPALLSATFLLALFAFFTQFAHPHVDLMATRNPRAVQARIGGSPWQSVNIGIASILLQTVLFMAAVLILIRRWRLPFGSLTLIFGLASLLISLMHDHYVFVPAAILAGLLCDLLLQRLQPAPARPNAFHSFAFAVPAIFYALYFAALALTDGIGWSVHLWTGAIVMSGITGLLLSYLIVPHALPETT